MSFTFVFFCITRIAPSAMKTCLVTIEGNQFNTYTEACRRLNLQDYDNKWHLWLAEADQNQATVQMRALFVTLLVCREPAEPLKLYDNYKLSLSDVSASNNANRDSHKNTRSRLQKTIFCATLKNDFSNTAAQQSTLLSVLQIFDSKFTGHRCR